MKLLHNTTRTKNGKSHEVTWIASKCSSRLDEVIFIITYISG